MEPDREQHFLRMAAERPDILCADAPDEVLEACAVEVEPTDFLEQYFAAGHSAWLAHKHGRTINKPQILVNQAILVLYRRACLLNTARLMGQTSEYANQPFFSDEDLY
jgi:hypothetical protein